MDEPQLIWRFGRWIARRDSGAARLGWTGGEMVIRIAKGKVVAIEGIHPNHVASALKCQPLGFSNLMEEAAALSERHGFPETRVLAVVKRCIVQSFRRWLLDPNRELEIVEGEPDPTEGPTISVSHILVELVLSDTDEHLFERILPDLDVLLRRHSNFLELYAPLRLTEEADLIVAKITGQRTAHEISMRSPHGSQEVVRLLAALVATGMLEPVPVVITSDEHQILSDEPEPPTAVRGRPLPIWWIVGAAFAFVIILGSLGLVLSRGSGGPEADAAQGRWGIAVDFGCEPEDLRRVYEKRNQDQRNLRMITVTVDDQECARLVWGEYGSETEADQAIESVPTSLIWKGFAPHAIELPPSEEPAASDEKG